MPYNETKVLLNNYELHFLSPWPLYKLFVENNNNNNKNNFFYCSVFEHALAVKNKERFLHMFKNDMNISINFESGKMILCSWSNSKNQ